MIFLALMIPALIGFLTGLLTLDRKSGLAHFALTLGLSTGLGFAVSSVLFFFWSAIFAPNFGLRWYLLIEMLLLLILLVCWFSAKRNSIRHFDIKLIRQNVLNSLRNMVGLARADIKSTLFYTALVTVFLLFLLNFLDDWYTLTVQAPDGGWDAWAIWNLRARFIYSGESWTRGFSPIIGWSHPDYPLLLPAFIGRTWLLLGDRTRMMPALVGLFFQAAVLLTVISSISHYRNWATGLFAGLFTLGVLQYSLLLRQYADIPLAFFILAFNVVYYKIQTSRTEKPFASLTAGLLLGAAIWTKNEGIAFFLSFVVVLFISIPGKIIGRSKYQPKWRYFFLGLMPFLAALIVFKVGFAPSNDILSNLEPGSIALKVIDPTRYRLILTGLVQQFLADWTLVIALLPMLLFFWFALGENGPAEHCAAISGIVYRTLFLLAAYCAVYIVTPNPLQWHIDTSMHRLFLHLLPTFIFAEFLRVEKISFSEKKEQGLENAAADTLV